MNEDKLQKSITKTMEFVTHFQVEIREQQDKMIQQTIRQIGGEQYETITLDKQKVLEALKKATAIVPIRQNKRYYCPDCDSPCAEIRYYPNPTPDYPNNYITHINGIYDYCRICGQKLDWKKAAEIRASSALEELKCEEDNQ